jgi:hypothetical protein
MTSLAEAIFIFFSSKFKPNGVTIFKVVREVKKSVKKLIDDYIDNCPKKVKAQSSRYRCYSSLS